MKSLLSLSLVAMLTLGACSGSHTSSMVPASSLKTSTAQKHVRHLQPSGNARRPSDIGGGPGRFLLNLMILDAPLIGANAANSKFNAGILGVDAIDGNGDSWQLIAFSTPQVVNLLDFQNSAFPLGNGSLPAGSYPSIQLLLDPATTTVTYNGTVYPVRFVDSNHPWWDTSQTVEAVRVPLTITGNAGDSLRATMDFNVFQSANLENGIVYLTPTVAAGMGEPAIAGKVVNAAGAPVSNATVVATDASGAVANTTFTAADGSFHIRGINAGGYTISVLNAYTTNAGATLNASGNDPGAAPTTFVTVAPDSQVNLIDLID
jgi:hypothetical protein